MWIAIIIILALIVLYFTISKKNNQDDKSTIGTIGTLGTVDTINAILRTKLNKLRTYLKGLNLPLSSYPSNKDLKRLLERTENTIIITQENPMITNNKPVIAQTHEKGKIIEICVSENNKVTTDINTMVYILLHELTHIMCIKHNEHDEEFRRYFNFLIGSAEKCGIYNQVNYSLNPVKYCGQLINDEDS